MPTCLVCGGTEFYIEAGFYFCQECQTQNEDIREEILELNVDPTTRVRKVRVRQDKSGTSEQNLGWTKWEQYNFILLGITNELIQLGASSDIKITILQLWANYLKNTEVAFTSTTERLLPRFSLKYRKRDAEIVYGRIARDRKKRKKSSAGSKTASSVISGAPSGGSSNRDISKQKKRMVEAEYERFVQSQASADGDTQSLTNQSLFSAQSSSGRSSVQTEYKIQFNKGARKEAAKIKVLSMKLPRSKRLNYRKRHVTTQYKISPQLLTPMKLWTLIYLALRIHNEPIHLADMLRYGREGHLSYYRLDYLLPPEVTLTRKETNLLHQTRELTHKGMRRAIGSMAKFLKVWETGVPDFAMLLERYCTDLQLPKGVKLYAERMMAMSPPKMRFDAKTPCFPNYEGRAMAFIVVVMKMLFGLDGITEYEISRVIEKINSAASARDVLDNELFSFREWQRYIECRRCVLANVHFPTKLKLEPNAPGNHHLYLKFMADIKSKSVDREEPEITSYKHLIPRELTDAMKASVERLNDITVSEPKEADTFGPSLTPQHSYLQQLLKDTEKDLPANLKIDFRSTKIGYMTNSEKLQALAAQCDIDLEIRDTGVHFIEKSVSPFEHSRLPTIEEFNKTVPVRKPAAPKARGDTSSREICEDAIEYLHRKNPGRITIDSSKRANYDTVRKSLRRRRREFTREHCDDFGFDQVLPSGKLAVDNDDDSDDESVHSDDFGFDQMLPSGKLAVGNNDDSDDESVDSDDFGFDQVLPSGKLAVGNDDDSDDESVHSVGHENVNDERIDSLSKYNMNLSNYEKSTLVGATIANVADSSARGATTRRNIPRDPVTGRFVSADQLANLEKTKNVSSRTLCERNEVAKLAAEENPEDEVSEIIELESDCEFGAQNDEDISILHDSTVNSSRPETSGHRFMDSRTTNEVETLFRPYTVYWMYRCKFSRVKLKNFRQFKKQLPQTFRWLLSECARVVEMPELDLYEEVCLVESYYTDILRPNDSQSNNNPYNRQEYLSKAHCNYVRNKW